MHNIWKNVATKYSLKWLLFTFRCLYNSSPCYSWVNGFIVKAQQVHSNEHLRLPCLFSWDMASIKKATIAIILIWGKLDSHNVAFFEHIPYLQTPASTQLEIYECSKHYASWKLIWSKSQVSNKDTFSVVIPAWVEKFHKGCFRIWSSSSTRVPSLYYCSLIFIFLKWNCSLIHS